jgi:aminopeptidase N
MPLTLSAFLVALAVGQAPSDPINLAVGDPARKTRTVTVLMDRIVDTTSGEHVSPAGIARALSDARFVLVGEQHTSVEAHRVQRQVIEALHASGRPVLLGLEMFPYTAQAALDQWRTQAISEHEFLAASKWYEHWAYPWRYYRDIFLFARDHKVPIVAINAPRDVVSAVRKKGLDKLTPEEARHIPREIATNDPEHLTLFKAYIGPDSAMHQGMSEEAWRSMLDAQATWDATMAYQAVRALEAAPRKDAVMVVLAGSGHVAYGLGIERQARRWLSGRIATVIPVPVGSREMQGVTVRASYANFVWGVAAEPWPAYPSLGISTRSNTGGLEIINVEKGSPAAAAGVKTGDVLKSFDGVAVTGRGQLSELMAGKNWSDEALVVVRRGDRDEMIQVSFVRNPSP